MALIFVSYRRVDTDAWAGRLYGDLARVFTRSQLFMDIDGHITRGSEFGKILRDALESCDALLALIGPRWLTCTREDGTLRLTAPDDWVRCEIARALKRGIPVIPVLFDGVSLPPKEQLPEEIRPLTDRHYAALGGDWEHDVGALIHDLERAVARIDVARSDIDVVGRALRVLTELVRRSSAVAESVARYREALATLAQQVEVIDVYKGLHDEFHVIEFECLRVMPSVPSTPQLRACKGTMQRVRERIARLLARRIVSDGLAADIEIKLDAAVGSLEVAEKQPSAATLEDAVADLTVLLTGIPSDLDQAISTAGSHLNLDRLIALFEDVQRRVALDAPVEHTDLSPIFAGVEALKAIAVELERRVSEHSRLQRIDNELRMLLSGSEPPKILARKWEFVKKLRAGLEAPFSRGVASEWENFALTEGEVDRVLGEGALVKDYLAGYHQTLASVFRDADSELKDMSTRVASVGLPIQTLLASTKT